MSEQRTMRIAPVPVNRAIVRVEGMTPLIVNQFSNKAQLEMEGKQKGENIEARAPKDPEALFRDSLHVLPGHEGDEVGTTGAYYFPSTGFKAAAIRGIGYLKLGKGLTMTSAKGAFFVDDFPGPTLEFAELVMRRDPVRTASGVADLHYRGEFREWAANLNVSYWPTAIRLEQIVAALNAGGYACGLGEWRPLPKKGNSGDYGRFRVTEVTDLSPNGKAQ